MPTNRFDQASRYLAKLDPPGFLRWLVPGLAPDVSFRGWLDTRSLPFPGEADRVCDTVACLAGPGTSARWAIPVEFQVKPDATMFGRLLEYLGRLWREERPAGGRGRRYHVGAALVNLTGARPTASRHMQLGRTRVRTHLQVAERNLAAESAAATLAVIASGGLAPCLLPWVPLMHGGGEEGIIQGWMHQAAKAPNSRLRGDYGGLALVFAELAGCQLPWREALEGWNMQESKQVLEWIAEGEAKGALQTRRDDLRMLLEDRFGPLPKKLLQRINGTADLDRLRAAIRQVLRLEKLSDLQL